LDIGAWGFSKHMSIITPAILQNLYKPLSTSHKGQNGRLLVIAGSHRYHGSLLLAIKVVSRIVDLVYVLVDDFNRKLIDDLKKESSVFIPVAKNDLGECVERVDALLIGPGLDGDRNITKILKKILKKYYDKKVVLDAGALRIVDPLDLHSNCVVTPHAQEFEHLFDCEPTPENVVKMAKYYQCAVVLKGKVDYVSDGKELAENTTGNAGMTKGGTGDVLAGLIAALIAKNPPFLSAQAGVYLNGLAGDRLYKEYGTFYNAEDLIDELGRVWKQNINSSPIPGERDGG